MKADQISNAALSKIQAAICGRPYETRNPMIRIMTIVCTCISNTAVLLRLATRYFLSQSMGGDDWFILAAVVCLAESHRKKWS